MNSDPSSGVPHMPARPAQPDKPAKLQGSLWSVVIAGAIGLALFVGLIFLAGALGPVVLGVGMVVGVIYVIACLHYLLWGRWLGDAIRQEVEAEEEDEAAKFEARKSKFD